MFYDLNTCLSSESVYSFGGWINLQQFNMQVSKTHYTFLNQRKGFNAVIKQNTAFFCKINCVSVFIIKCCSSVVVFWLAEFLVPYQKWICVIWHLNFIYSSVLLLLESSAVWLIWKPLPVHPFTSVGKQKWQKNINIKSYDSISTSWTFMFYLSWLDLGLSSGSTYVSRSVSSAFHLLRNHQRSGVWKLHQGTFTVVFVSSQILIIVNMEVTKNKPLMGNTDISSRYIIIFIWGYFIPEGCMSLQWYSISCGFFVSLKKQLSPQLQQGTIVNGQVLESQRTTFVKQLKLGKVTLCCSCRYQLSTISLICYSPVKDQ